MTRKLFITTLLITLLIAIGWSPAGVGPTAAYAQVTLQRTTFSAAVALGDNTVTLASATSVASGSIIFSGIEEMIIAPGYVSGTQVRVIRGQNGTYQTAHNSGDQVYVGIPAYFTHNLKSGRCVSTAELVLPLVFVGDNRNGAPMLYGCDATTNQWFQYQEYPSFTRVAPSHTVANANYTALMTDEIILITSVTGQKVITLPCNTVPAGKTWIVTDESGSPGTGIASIWVNPNPAGTANLYPGSLINTGFSTKTFQSDGTGCWVR